MSTVLAIDEAEATVANAVSLGEEEGQTVDVLASETKHIRDTLIAFMLSLQDMLKGSFIQYFNPDEKEKLLRGIRDVEEWLVSARLQDMARSAYEERCVMMNALCERSVRIYQEELELLPVVSNLRKIISTFFLSAADNASGRSAVEFGVATLTWLEEQQARQSQLPKYADPILRVEDVADKTNQMKRVIAAVSAHREQQEADPYWAISNLRQMLQHTRHDHPAYTEGLATLGHLLASRFHETGKREDIDESIAKLSEAVRLTPDGHEDKPRRVQNLGIIFKVSFERTGEIADLNQAILHQQEAVRIMPDGHATKPAYVNNLASSFSLRFDHSGETADIDQAILHYDEASHLMSTGHPGKLACLETVGNLFLTRFERLGNIADIDDAISRYEEAVRCTPDGHPDMLSHISSLGNVSLVRFQRVREIADIDKAIAYLELVVHLLPDGHAEKPNNLGNLGKALGMRFERLGEIADINKAVRCYEKAINISHNEQAGRPVYLNNLGISLSIRFSRLGEIADIDDAISYQEEAVRMTSHEDEERPGRLTNLGNSLLRRFQSSGHIADMNKAISYLGEAVDSAPDEHAGKASYLNNLGNALSMRFERLGDIADLDGAISHQQQAVQMAPGDQVHRSTYLNNLGTLLRMRFERLGEITLIDNAISTQEEAVRTTPDGHPDKPGRLNNLGSSYMRRFQRLVEPADIDKAISFQEGAVRMTPDEDTERPVYLVNLGNSLSRRFELQGDATDIEKSIAHLEEAARSFPESHVGKPTCLNSLGNTFLSRFERLGDADDLDKGISHLETAICSMSDGHIDKPGCLKGLGNSFLTRFERLGEIADVDKAISYHQAAARMMPDGHANKAGCLETLGNSYSMRFQRLREDTDLTAAISAYTSATHSPTGPPSVRFRAAVAWAKHARLSDESPGLALEAYAAALELLPLVAWLGLPVDSRHRELVRAGAVACDAAAAALAAHDPQRALEWLEQGRSIVWGQILQLRTPLDELRETNPVLADRLAAVSLELERGRPQGALVDPRPALNRPMSAEKVSQKHRQLAREWEDLVQEVRGLPGFGRFLRPKRYSELADASRAGPVVVLNVSTLRCDALILVSPHGPLQHVKLDTFSCEQAEKLSRALLSTLQRRGDVADVPGWSADDTFREILTELWSCVVKPVLDYLSFQQAALRDLRRIWWCPTGPLTFLPIHAAGIYPPGSMRPLVSLPDFAISSYTPTLSALLNSLPKSAGRDSELLAVVHRGTPETGQLPGTGAELRNIRRRAVGFKIQALEGTKATAAEVLSGMEACAWVHFACHGVQDTANPIKSGLLLDDGRLELSAIIERRLPHAEFAFLSACETATGDGRLPDEAVHLAAGMLLAGYRGVVATMWSIEDGDAPFVADKLYSELVRDGRADSTNAARALHMAVRRLRERHSNGSFASWVPFIHVGM